MDWVKYPPGVMTSNRLNGYYNEDQTKLWKAYADTYYAMMYGFEMTRQPSPGKVIDIKRYTEWKKQVLFELNYQTLRSGNKTPERNQGKLDDEFPEHIWQYLYQRCLSNEGDIL